jgi:hypothetical protein
MDPKTSRNLAEYQPKSCAFLAKTRRKTSDLFTSQTTPKLGMSILPGNRPFLVELRRE